MGKQENKTNDEKTSADESETSANVNKFNDDGSFLAQFQKKMAEMRRKENSSSSPNNSPKNEAVEDDDRDDSEASSSKTAAKIKTVEVQQTQQQGKRKITVGKMGGFAKKPTAKKSKEESESEDKPSAWQSYLKEVQKYKDASGCADNDHFSRPLVK